MHDRRSATPSRGGSDNFDRSYQISYSRPEGGNNLDTPWTMGYTGSTVHNVTIHTDGACSGNPGPGGWGAVLVSGTVRKEISGGEASTTNNRMELAAAIQALAALRQPAEVDLYTDSVYVRSGITEWILAWKANGWRRRSGKRWLSVKNEDLWRELDRLASLHRVRFHWTEGHAGNPENERADALARSAIPRTERRTIST